MQSVNARCSLLLLAIVVMAGMRVMAAPMVYTMTNAATGNAVVAFSQADNGILTFVDSYETGGNGTGTTEVSAATPQDGIDPLASQGSLTISRDHRFLFAVNAGSGTISVFSVADNGTLICTDVQPSGGSQPNSVSAFGNLLYVANVGNAANNFASNVTGFHVGNDGKLTRINGSTHALSTANAQPAQVLFTNNGRYLFVSELTAKTISAFRVNADGTLTGPVANASNGAGPFGMVFLASGRMLVAEALAKAVSSYNVADDGKLTVISGSVVNGQDLPCWVVTTPNGRFTFTSNTGSDTLSSYSIGENGILTLLEGAAYKFEDAASGPIDLGISTDGRYLNVLDGGLGTVTVFRISDAGKLTRVQAISGRLPKLGAQGLAVR